jgi:hypothetical protein
MSNGSVAIEARRQTIGGRPPARTKPNVAAGFALGAL